MGSSKRDIELEEQLKEAGTLLLGPPSSVDELIDLLDRVENLLATVEQAPSRPMQDALLPSLKALVMNELLSHPDPDVRLSLASCFSEITRITAPEAPYSDELMKEIFRLIVAAFEKLSHASGLCYMKTVSILDTVAKVRSCLLMLDLECDALIIEMFRHFLITIGSNHPHAVFSAMETIMTLVIDESEDVSWDLLSILLASVRQENQDVSPISWKLGEKVITNCSAKLKTNLMEAVQCRGVALNEYAKIVASICGNGCENLQYGHLCDTENPIEPDSFCPEEVCLDVDGIPKSATCNGTAPSRNENSSIKDNSLKVLELCSHVEHSKSVDARCSVGPGNLDPLRTVKSEFKSESAPKRRGWKPNSLMNPKEGYDHSWICTRRKDPKVSGRKMPDDKGVDCSRSENQDSKKKAIHSSHKKVGHRVSSSPKSDSLDVSGHGGSRPKKQGSMMNQDADASSFTVSLSTQVEQKASGSVDLGLGKEPEDKFDTELKRRKCSKTNEETSGPPEYGFSERKVEVPSDLNEKPWQLSVTKKRCRSINNDRTTVQADISKANVVVAISTKGITEAAGAKEVISEAAFKSSNRDGNYLGETPKIEVKKKHTTGREEKKVISKAAKSSARDGNHSEKTPKTGVKRKHTDGKEVASETPGLGEQLVGRRIKVWWPMDKTFYEGLVDSYDHIKKKHRILYADGDEEILNLKKQHWELIGDGKLSEVGQETNELKSDASTDKCFPYI